MTTPHADWPRTLEWIEKQAQESLKARFATNEIIAKDAQTTLTVLLAGIGGSAAYAAKIFELGPAGPIEVAAAVVCVYFVILAVILVWFCMMFRSYPALYQNPENLMHPECSLDAIRQAEIENMEVRIKEAAQLNAERAKRLNWLRIALIVSPFMFVVAAALTPKKTATAAEKSKIVCKVDHQNSGAAAITIECDIAK